jgi:1-deoxy-D-xylulose-5-phosphate synthase
MAPADENECRQMLYTAATLDGPAAVRYPRGVGPGVPIEREMTALAIGRARRLREGRSGLAFLCFGTPLSACTELAHRLDATLVDMRFVKPLDEDLLAELAAHHEACVTVEENVVAGGAGSAVLEFLERRGLPLRVLQLGLPDRFIEHGSRGENLQEAGLDAAGIARAVALFWQPRAARACPGAAG